MKLPISMLVEEVATNFQLAESVHWIVSNNPYSRVVFPTLTYPQIPNTLPTALSEMGHLLTTYDMNLLDVSITSEGIIYKAPMSLPPLVTVANLIQQELIAARDYHLSSNRPHDDDYLTDLNTAIDELNEVDKPQTIINLTLVHLDICTRITKRNTYETYFNNTVKF